MRQIRMPSAVLIAVMSGATVRDDVPALSLLALLGSALCFAQAAILVRRFPPVHPVAMNAVAMGTGAVLLLAGSLLAREKITLVVANLQTRLLKKFDSAGLVDSIGREHFYPTVQAAVTACAGSLSL